MAKHVCITGCTRGLGRALSQWFLLDGWRVSGFGRSRDGIETLNAEAPEGGSLFECLDVTDDAAVANFAHHVAKVFGPPDLLINNAGVINANGQLWEITAAEFDQVVDVNLKGVANVLRHFTPLMIKRGSGIVINMSSGWGRSTSPEVAPYCATKWAIEGLSQAMAQELPRGLAVAAMNPGVVDTEMLRSCFGESAAGHQRAEEWAQRAGPFLAALTPSINGKPLTAP